jgi:hypothetical protein
VFNVDTDHGAFDDRGCVAVSPVASPVQTGMQAVPGLDPDLAVARVGHDQLVVGGSPAGGVGAFRACPVAWGTSPGSRWPVRPGGWVGVKDAVVADPAEDLESVHGEVRAESDAVVAGIEDEQGRLVA